MWQNGTTRFEKKVCYLGDGDEFSPYVIIENFTIIEYQKYDLVTSYQIHQYHKMK